MPIPRQKPRNCEVTAASLSVTGATLPGPYLQIHECDVMTHCPLVGLCVWHVSLANGRFQVGETYGTSYSLKVHNYARGNDSRS